MNEEEIRIMREKLIRREGYEKGFYHGHLLYGSILAVILIIEKILT